MPQRSGYTVLNQSENLKIESQPQDNPAAHSAGSLGKRAILQIIAVCFLTASFIAGILVGARVSLSWTETTSVGQAQEPTTICSDPVLRQEWRSLSKNDKEAYLKAATCLTKLPSKLGRNQSYHDDFAWTHKQIGETSHEAAMFVAWHRAFIHAYENALQTACGYRGHLAYWDWTLDWEDITKAPVWNTDNGFGGDGNRKTEANMLHSYCVTDGPFANLSIPYIEDVEHPHCLSRAFESRAKLDEQGQYLRPAHIDKLLSMDDYEAFNLGLESGPHFAIPKSVSGDFSVHTAPSDPVFFLHHTQLDRIWWKWQQKDPLNRIRQYRGRSFTDSEAKASVTDKLLYGIDRIRTIFDNPHDTNLAAAMKTLEEMEMVLRLSNRNSDRT